MTTRRLLIGLAGRLHPSCRHGTLRRHTSDNEWPCEAHANNAPYGLICASYFTVFWVAMSIYSNIFFILFLSLFPVPHSISFYFLEAWKEEGKTVFGIAVSFPSPMIVLLTHQAAYSLLLAWEPPV